MNPGLTQRQCDVLALTAAGHKQTAIAAALKISRSMVQKHLIAARKKCGDSTTTTAAVFFLCQQPTSRRRLADAQLSLNL